MSFTAVVSGETAITARGPVKEAAERVLGRLWIDQVPVRLASEDPSLWPSAATAGVAGRPLCWPGQPGPGRAALDRAEELRARARADGLTEVVLLGGGAPARAAELIAAAAGAPLTVLDGLEPGPPLRLRDDGERLARTVIVVTGDDPAAETLRPVLAGMLGDAGFSPAEVNQLRLQFRSVHAARHTPDTMPSPDALRTMEDAWMDSNGPAGPSEDAFGEDAASGGIGALLDVFLQGIATGFFLPVGSLVWLLREEGLWSRRRQVAVVFGVVVGVVVGLFRVISGEGD